MDDAFVVRGCERVGKRVGDVEDPLDRQAALGNGAVERLALDELHGEEVDALGFLDREDRDDARMIEGGKGFGLASEALEAVGTCGHPGGQHLERHVAAESRVGRADILRPFRLRPTWRGRGSGRGTARSSRPRQGYGEISPSLAV